MQTTASIDRFRLPIAIRALNKFGAMFNGKVSRRLTPDELIEIATRRAGLNDFGDGAVIGAVNLAQIPRGRSRPRARSSRRDRKPEPPQPSPYVHRVVPMFLFRRIARPGGNAQKSMMAPENRRRPNFAKGANYDIAVVRK